ncbi:MAG: adenylate/guanylate cyclase domain-containing protein [Bacteroidota bacterium]|nr:HAMP domain-containing protein [Candidatus Kapabacteria bacterium]MDW8218926.1 adenylate/guanylate cyclase domain-containing protein [Bacteroidota bacterium]
MAFHHRALASYVRHQRSSISTQISLLIFLFIIALTALNVIASSIQQKESGEEFVLQETRAIGELAAAGSTGGVVFNDRDFLAKSMQGIEQLSTFEAIIIRNTTGDSIYTKNASILTPFLGSRQTQQPDTLIRVFLHNDIAIARVPIVAVVNREYLGEVFLALNTRATQQSIQRSRTTLLLIGILGAMVCTVGALYFALHLAKPIVALYNAAQRISEGDLRQRVHIAASSHEVDGLIQAFNSMMDSLEHSNQALKVEQERSEHLLLNMLPAPIAERMKAGEKLIADTYHAVTVMFIDIVGFTTLASTMPAEHLVAMLNQVFSHFDTILRKHKVEKIKTIGDGYMAVSGLPYSAAEHAHNAAYTALELIDSMSRLNSEQGLSLDIRIGLHAGTVVAGVIGQHKFAYDLWGDTVNVASRMESHGEKGKIHCSEAVYALLHHDFAFEERGAMHIKGKGDMKTYFLLHPLH